MSVRIHYPEVFDDSSGMDQDLDYQTEGFIDFEQRLDWTFRMARHEGKRLEGPTQAWQKLPLDNNTTNDETQAAWH